MGHEGAGLLDRQQAARPPRRVRVPHQQHAELVLTGDDLVAHDALALL
jgi:hypothetical protein